MKPLFLHILVGVWFCLPIRAIGQAQMPDLRVDASKLKIAQAMEKQALVANDSLRLGKAYYLFGEAYNIGGSNATAKNYFLKARRILKPLGDSYELGMTYLHLIEGIHLTATSREDIEYAQEAIAVFTRIHSTGGLARGYNYLTSAYKRKWIWPGTDINQFKANKSRFDTLVHCINTTEHYARLANDTNMMAEASQQRGDMYRCLHDKQAIAYFTEAQRLFSAAGNDTLVVHVSCQLVDTYLMLSAYDKAGQALKQAQTLVRKTGINEYWMTTHLYETARNYYRQTGQWQQAYTCQEVLSDLYTYRLKGTRDQLVAGLNSEYETKKKETLLRAQSNELSTLRLQKRFTIVTSILLLLTAVLSVVFFRLNRKNKRISRINEELVKEQNHRVKNNLQLMSSLLNLQAKRLTDPVAQKAIDESRLRLQSMVIVHKQLYDNDRMAKITLADFFQELTDGVLDAYGFWDATTSITIDAITVSIDKALPLGIILNELATNACKYAFPDNEVPELRITCHREKNKLYLTVADNGPGIRAGTETTAQEREESETARKGSFGMQLIRAQVAQLNGTYAFQNTQGGVVFTMHCPL